MGRINCCRYCVAPKRYPGCHDHCAEYAEEKAENDRLRELDAKKRYINNGIYEQRTRSVVKAVKHRRKP